MTTREFVLSMAVTLGGHMLGDKLFEYPEPKPNILPKPRLNAMRQWQGQAV
jgi:hypothetical protein